MVILVSVMAMLCKSFIDFIGNKTALDSKGDNVNTYYLIQSLTMLVLLLAALLVGINTVKLDGPGLFYGLLIGVFSFFSYWFFLQSLKGENGSVSITIYRLNFIVSSALGILLLGEKLTAGKAAGIVFCAGAILMFVNFKTVVNGKFDKYLFFSLLGCLSAGVMNIFNKMALDKGITSDSLLTIRFVVVVAAIFASYRISHIRIHISRDAAGRKLVTWSVVSGCLMLLSLYLLYYALQIGDVSVVTPVVQSCFIFTSILCFIFFKEKLTWRKSAGIILAVLCIAVIGL